MNFQISENINPRQLQTLGRTINTPQQSMLFVGCIKCASLSKEFNDNVLISFILINLDTIYINIHDFKINKVARVNILSQALHEHQHSKTESIQNLVQKECSKVLNDLTKKFNQATNTMTCIKSLVSARINCTTKHCEKSIKEFGTETVTKLFRMQKAQEGAGKFRHIHSVGYGAAFYGNRFSLFVRKAELKYESSSFSGLIETCTWRIWIMLGVTVLSLCSLLKMTGFSWNNWFWLTSVLIEQEGDARSKCKNANWHLIICWILATFVLRNWYTSFMYSNMTNDPGPKYEYDKFDELIFKTNTTLLSATLVFDGINKQRMYAESRMHSRLVKQITRLWATDSPAQLLEDISDSKYLSKTFCEHRLFKKSFFKEKKSLLLDFSPTWCLRASEFMYLYTTPQTTNLRHIPFLVSKLLIYKLNRHYIHETNEPYLDTEAVLWYTKTGSFYQPTVENILASIVETGIQKHQYDRLELLGIRCHLKDYFRKYKINSNDSNLIKKAVSMWLSNGCFLLFKEVCALQNILDILPEFTVWLKDITAVWKIYGVMVLTSIFAFVSELFYSKRYTFFSE